jgi:UDP-glucose 4-epimerase
LQKLLKKINYQILPKRVGDITTCLADIQYTTENLDWRAKANLDKMIKDHWNWQKKNPNDYKNVP